MIIDIRSKWQKVVSHSDDKSGWKPQEFNVLEYLVSYTTNVDEPQAQDLEFAMYPLSTM